MHHKQRNKRNIQHGPILPKPFSWVCWQIFPDLKLLSVCIATSQLRRYQVMHHKQRNKGNIQSHPLLPTPFSWVCWHIFFNIKLSWLWLVSSQLWRSQDTHTTTKKQTEIQHETLFPTPLPSGTLTLRNGPANLPSPLSSILSLLSHLFCQHPRPSPGTRRVLLVPDRRGPGTRRQETEVREHSHHHQHRHQRDLSNRKWPQPPEVYVDIQRLRLIPGQAGFH